MNIYAKQTHIHRKKKQPVVTKIEREAGRDKLGVWV